MKQLKVGIPAGKKHFNLYEKGLISAMEDHRNFFMRVYIHRHRRGWSRAEFIRLITQQGSTISVAYLDAMENFAVQSHRYIIYKIIAGFFNVEVSDWFRQITYDEQVEYNRYYEANVNKMKPARNKRNAA